jgi:CHASE3 domain sensor protein
MDKKIIFKFIVKVLLYALGLIASYLGVTSLTSCTVQRTSQSSGHARIVVSDTTDIIYNGNFYLRPGRRR